MRSRITVLIGGLSAFIAVVGFATIMAVRPVSLVLPQGVQPQRGRIVDRSGGALSVSYHDTWNYDDAAPLHRVPELLQRALVVSEDKRFFEHSGVDWRARMSALWQHLIGGGGRGASTISEQIVRMVHPRSRTLWTKWLEGWEAQELERRYSKSILLEFYCNQVPYAGNRRGVVQAARYYFNRELETLNLREILALAVLVRAPSRFDLYREKVPLSGAISRLADRLVVLGALSHEQRDTLDQYPLVLTAPSPVVDASHFLHFIRSHGELSVVPASHRVSTLDARIQQEVSALLKDRLRTLRSKRVGHGAVLVADHSRGEILAWVSTGSDCEVDHNRGAGCAIDMVRSPRQPGSAMKPFLYAAALEGGWSAATVLDDEPFADVVGDGIHRFRNYSRTYYGKVTLRQALGNSLNIPAIHTINFVGPAKYLDLLRHLGFTSLTQPAQFYDDGLALGNGEVSLFELVQGYQALANRGVETPLRFFVEDREPRSPKQIFSPETASLIGNILSDPWARSLEFGAHSVLNLPTQTAVKTGTSTDYNDAWIVGYDSTFIVGIWMGNVDRTPMDGVTGSTGPALLLRSIFNRLTLNRETKPLYLSPRLVARESCQPNSTGGGARFECSPVVELFRSDDAVMAHYAGASSERSSPSSRKSIAIERPQNGLSLAYDPRLPAEKQAFSMHVSGVLPRDRVEWIIDGSSVYRAIGSGDYLWPLLRGEHSVAVTVTTSEGQQHTLGPSTVRVW